MYDYSDWESWIVNQLDRKDVNARICLMGTRRCGKSSIQRVVFDKVSPHETLFLQSTNELELHDISTSALCNFQLLDFPGNFLMDKRSTITPERVFEKTGSLVFVIDAQDDETYAESFDYFAQMAKLAYSVNKRNEFHVLIHKVDGDAYLSDDHKNQCMQDIVKSIREELSDAKLYDVRPTFYLTSIYDHSIFEAFSKIVQKLIPQLGSLENLLNALNESCGIEKSFLFDVVSKIYVATDTLPVNMQTYELCSDMIDVVIDVSCIYGLKEKGDNFPSDADSSSIIKLSNGYQLYLREVNKYLALVCLMPNNQSFSSAGLVEYNFATFKKGVAQIIESASKTNKERSDSTERKE